ncbi:hypothetical protein CLV59_107379 [Chitinophaga dinghuensis]|uniref:Imm33-like domain-containing protein n=1 Tax=Chitinophaga dinghuensis TaxID=1539050 RepID=A0A327VU75_9BACT|nr:hypothetical protein [Chitinophaga dinghuensis]RAJ77610.1 hypothetical protein CLV59_107379 [Chitinophaga dinghuensis]
MDNTLFKFEKEVQERQKLICAKYGAIYYHTPVTQLLGIATQTFAAVEWPINGLRNPIQSEQSSNWYIWAGEQFSDTADFFEPMHIFHLRDNHPKILDYLGLPPGWRFLFVGDDHYEDVWFDESLLRI